MNELSISQLQSENERLRGRLDAAEALLRVERQLFQAMAETLTDIVFTASPDGAWDFVNARIYETTELSVGSALGNGWTEALHPDDRERVMRDLLEAVAAGTSFESYFRLRSADGTYRRNVTQAQPLCDDGGKIMRWIGTATDVDDLLTTEDALQQAKGRNNEILSKLTHDLRNAVAPIQNAVVILQNPGADATHRQRALEIIEGQVRELRAFLDNLQESSRGTRCP